MKTIILDSNITIALLFVLFMPALTSANELSDRLNFVYSNLKYLTEQITNLDKNVGEVLIEEKARLSATDEILKYAEGNLPSKYVDLAERTKTEYEYPLKAYRARKAVHEDDIRDHNSRCTGTFEDEDYVDVCNREADLLDEKSRNLETESAELKIIGNQKKQALIDLNDYAKGLQDRRKEFSQATLDWAAKTKTYNSDRNGLSSSYNRALTELQNLVEEYSNCANQLLVDAQDEEVKLKCGNVQFDNIRENLLYLRNIKPQIITAPE